MSSIIREIERTSNQEANLLKFSKIVLVTYTIYYLSIFNNSSIEFTKFNARG